MMYLQLVSHAPQSAAIRAVRVLCIDIAKATELVASPNACTVGRAAQSHVIHYSKWPRMVATGSWHGLFLILAWVHLILLSSSGTKCATTDCEALQWGCQSVAERTSHLMLGDQRGLHRLIRLLLCGCRSVTGHSMQSMQHALNLPTDSLVVV